MYVKTLEYFWPTFFNFEPLCVVGFIARTTRPLAFDRQISSAKRRKSRVTRSASTRALFSRTRSSEKINTINTQALRALTNPTVCTRFVSFFFENNSFLSGRTLSERRRLRISAVGPRVARHGFRPPPRRAHRLERRFSSPKRPFFIAARVIKKTIFNFLFSRHVLFACVNTV